MDHIQPPIQIPRFWPRVKKYLWLILISSFYSLVALGISIFFVYGGWSALAYFSPDYILNPPSGPLRMIWKQYGWVLVVFYFGANMLIALFQDKIHRGVLHYQYKRKNRKIAFEIKDFLETVRKTKPQRDAWPERYNTLLRNLDQLIEIYNARSKAAEACREDLRKFTQQCEELFWDYRDFLFSRDTQQFKKACKEIERDLPTAYKAIREALESIGENLTWKKMAPFAEIDAFLAAQNTDLKLIEKIESEVVALLSYWFRGWRFIGCYHWEDIYFTVLQKGGEFLLRKWQAEDPPQKAPIERTLKRLEEERDYHCLIDGLAKFLGLTEPQKDQLKRQISKVLKFYLGYDSTKTEILYQRRENSITCKIGLRFEKFWLFFGPYAKIHYSYSLSETEEKSAFFWRKNLSDCEGRLKAILKLQKKLAHLKPSDHLESIQKNLISDLNYHICRKNHNCFQHNLRPFNTEYLYFYWRGILLKYQTYYRSEFLLKKSPEELRKELFLQLEKNILEVAKRKGQTQSELIRDSISLCIRETLYKLLLS